MTVFVHVALQCEMPFTAASVSPIALHKDQPERRPLSAFFATNVLARVKSPACYYRKSVEKQSS